MERLMYFGTTAKRSSTAADEASIESSSLGMSANFGTLSTSCNSWSSGLMPPTFQNSGSKRRLRDFSISGPRSRTTEVLASDQVLQIPASAFHWLAISSNRLAGPNDGSPASPGLFSAELMASSLDHRCKQDAIAVIAALSPPAALAAKVATENSKRQTAARAFSLAH